MAFVLLDGKGNVTSLFEKLPGPMPGLATIADTDPRIAAYNTLQAGPPFAPGSVTYNGSVLVVASVTGNSAVTMPGPLIAPAV